MGSRLALAALVAVLSAPAGAAGEPTMLSKAGTDSVFLSGGQVVWSELWSAYAARPGEAPRLVYAAPAVDGDSESQRISLVAGGGSFAIGREVETHTGGQLYRSRLDARNHLYAGWLGEEPRELSTCGGYSVGLPDYDVDGALVAWRAECEEVAPSGGIMVSDLSAPHAPARLLVTAEEGHYIWDPRVAGDLVGFVSERRAERPRPGELVVYDARVGRELYRVKAPRVLFTWDLQADGKLAIHYGDDGPKGATPTVRWHSPADRAPHDTVISTTFQSVSETRIRFVADRMIVPRLQAPRTVDLVSVHLDGTIVSLAPFMEDEFDFDGERLAWASATCRHPQAVLTAPASGDTTVDHPRCPTRVARGPLRLGRKTVEVPLVCPRGCQGRVDLRFGYGNFRTFRLRPPGGTVKVRIHPEGWKRFLRQRPQALALRIPNLVPGHRAVRTSRPVAWPG